MPATTPPAPAITAASPSGSAYQGFVAVVGAGESDGATIPVALVVVVVGVVVVLGTVAGTQRSMFARAFSASSLAGLVCKKARYAAEASTQRPAFRCACPIA